MARLIVSLLLVFKMLLLGWASATEPIAFDLPHFAEVVAVDDLLWRVGPTPKRNRKRGGMGMRQYRRWSRQQDRRYWKAREEADLSKVLPESTLTREAMKAYWGEVRRKAMAANRQAKAARKAAKLATRKAQVQARVIREQKRAAKLREKRLKRQARKEARMAKLQAEQEALRAARRAEHERRVREKVARLEAEAKAKAEARRKERAEAEERAEARKERILRSWHATGKLRSRRAQKFLADRGWVTREDIDKFYRDEKLRRERRWLLREARKLHKQVGGFVPTFVCMDDRGQKFVTTVNVPGSQKVSDRIADIDFLTNPINRSWDTLVASWLWEAARAN